MAAFKAGRPRASLGASADLTNEGDPELRRLRRYESALFSKLRWCLRQITIESPHRFAHDELRPDWAADFEPEPAPEPEPKHPAEGWSARSIQPTFCLKPDEFPEPGKPADIPAILTGRRRKRFEKAEARREARRKKVERLRA